MSALSNLSIKLRLTILSAFALTLLIILSIVSVNALSNAAKSLKTVYHDRLIPTGQLGRIELAVQTIQTELLLSAQHNPSHPLRSSHQHPLDQHLNVVDGAVSLIKKDWSAYLSTHLTAEEKQLSDTVDAQLERMLTQGVVPALMALRQADFAAANQILLTTLRPEAGTLAGTLEQILELQSAIAEQEYQNAETSYQNTLIIAAITTLVALTVLLLMSWSIIHGISASVTRLEQASTRLADGDLTSRANDRRTDELGRISQAFDRMAERFQNTINQVAGSSGQLAAAAEETCSSMKSSR